MTMKRMTALIVSLMMILVCLASAMAETAAEEPDTEKTAAIPQKIAAESYEEFIGEWKMTGMIYMGKFYNMEQMQANGLIVDANDRIFHIREDKTCVLYYLEEPLEFSCEMDEANGTLTLIAEGGKMFLALQDDGTMADEDEYGTVAIFTRVEEAAE